MTCRPDRIRTALCALLAAAPLLHPSVSQANEADAPASDEDRAVLESIELLWDLPLLEEWDPQEDLPRPLVDETAPPRDSASESESESDGEARP